MLRMPIDMESVLDAIPVIVAIHDTDQKILWANKAYLKATGRSLQETVGMKCHTVWGLSAPCLGCPVSLAIKSGEQHQAELTPHNQKHWPVDQGFWLSKAVPIRDVSGRIIGAVETAYDITDRIQAEEALFVSEKSLRAAAKAASFGVYSYDFSYDRAYYSPEFMTLFGLLPGMHLPLDEELVAKALHPDDKAGFLGSMKAANDPCGSGSLDHEYRIIRPDGQIRWLRVIGQTVFSGRQPEDRPLHANGIVQDITATKTILQKLEVAEMQYRTVVEDQTELISRFSADGKFLFVNKAYCRFFQKKDHELIGRNWQPIAFEEDHEMIKRQLARLSPTHPVVVIENRVYNGDGCICWIQFINRGIFDSSNNLIEIQSVGRDVSDLKDIQMTLQRKDAELSEKNARLEKLNIALEVVLDQKNAQLESLRSDIINQYNKFVKPHLEELKNISHNQQEKQYLRLINHGMQHILSPFARHVMSLNHHLSPMETKVASLIAGGGTIQSIALELKISHHTVKYHRKSIRSKLGIKNEKVNLSSYLVGKVDGLKE